MKVVDAFWEKRNLGVVTVEIEIDKSDSLDMCKQVLRDTKAEYVVVKLPVCMMDIQLFLQDSGFVFIESAARITRDLSDLNLSGFQKRLLDAVCSAPMDDSDLEQLFCEIKSGMFNTDRIFLDPYFTKENAADRYVNWIKDEMDRGSGIYKLVFEEEVIGFFGIKSRDGVFNPFLGGIYEKYKSWGLGTSICAKAILEASKQNGKSIETHISINNEAISRLYHSVGFSFRFYYVFVKHKFLEI